MVALEDCEGCMIIVPVFDPVPLILDIGVDGLPIDVFTAGCTTVVLAFDVGTDGFIITVFVFLVPQQLLKQVIQPSTKSAAQISSSSSNTGTATSVVSSTKVPVTSPLILGAPALRFTS
jgi:hypothetical protein